MTLNINTQHTLLCTTSATKSQKLLTIQGSPMHCSCSFEYEQGTLHINIHKLKHKLTLTNIPNIIIKFIANYIKGQHACTQYIGTLSKLKKINTGVPQGGVLSPTLVNIYISVIPLPPKDVQITTYADDIKITASHIKHRKAQKIIQSYVQKI